MIKKLALLMITMLFLTTGISAQDAEKSVEQRERKGDEDPLEKINKSLGKLVKLPQGEVWIDTKKKIVVIDGMIVLRKGALEMLACPPETKEHETIIQAQADSYIVHTALLMVGAKSGSPVVWEPKYKAANGTKIEIMVHWLDEKGKEKKLRAQEMIRNVKTKKAMTEDWVFAGSEFYTNPNTKKKHYMADSGEMICVANFTTAMMDLPIESSQSREGLIFEAFTENIPPIRTKVRLVLKPVAKKSEKKPEKEAKQVEDSKKENAADKANK